MEQNKKNTRIYLRENDKIKLKEISDYYGASMIYTLKNLIEREHKRITKNDNR